jgi:hypothetical protein
MARIEAALSAVGCLGLAGAASGLEAGMISFLMQDPPPSCTSGMPGMNCHAAMSDDVFVEISGPPVLAPGESATYITEIKGGIQLGSGLNVSLFFQALEEQTPTQIPVEIPSELPPGLAQDDVDRLFPFSEGPPSPEEFTHYVADIEECRASPANCTFLYRFPITAPSQEGTLTVKSAMNSFDGNGQNTNDKWNRELGFEIEVVPEPGPTLATLTALATLSLLARRRGA